MKTVRASFAASIAGLFLVLAGHAHATTQNTLATANAGGPQPVRQSLDVKKIQEERRVIEENAQGDRKKLIEDINAFNKRTAAALGPEYEALYAERQRLLKKYGPLGSHIEKGGECWGSPSDIIDTAAWVTTVKKAGEGLIVSAVLDPRRYAGATPASIIFQMVEKDNAYKNAVRAVNTPDDSKRLVPLKYDMKEGTYTLSAAIPIVDRDRLVVQIFAEIEPTWSTMTMVDLTEPSTRVRPPRPERRSAPERVLKQP